MTPKSYSEASLLNVNSIKYPTDAITVKQLTNISSRFAMYGDWADLGFPDSPLRAIANERALVWYQYNTQSPESSKQQQEWAAGVDARTVAHELANQYVELGLAPDYSCGVELVSNLTGQVNHQLRNASKTPARGR